MDERKTKKNMYELQKYFMLGVKMKTTKKNSFYKRRDSVVFYLFKEMRRTKEHPEK